jgi:8-oxo-dGTP pyrophosphatase MutT (NUDIX family)
MADRVVEGCGALIYSADTRRYLFLLRGRGRYGNSWGLAGGKIEKGELPVDALRREISEETGYDITGLKVTPIEKFTSDGGFAYHTFMIVTDQEFIPSLNHEHQGYCWVPLERYPQPLHPGVWRTFKFTEIINKIKTIERQRSASSAN